MDSVWDAPLMRECKVCGTRWEDPVKCPGCSSIRYEMRPGFYWGTPGQTSPNPFGPFATEAKAKGNMGLTGDRLRRNNRR